MMPGGMSWLECSFLFVYLHFNLGYLLPCEMFQSSQTAFSSGLDIHFEAGLKGQANSHRLK